ncbi:uncharacterized protein [Drosophila virilis]|uniref:uncharacterized protein isoform X2 n=1 Tax=Drosophila virilis TaxID=7244 RepID=UPI0013965F5D|nr:uncharacterized protein LOC6627231 isoform X4 [Drosophila virilis]
MDDRVGTYQRTRRKFAAIVYLITFCWLLLGLAQWLVVLLVSPAKDTFLSYHWMSIVCFTLSITLALLFIFFEAARFVTCVNWLITILIVQFAIMGLFALVANSSWPELIMWFAICVLLLFIFVLLGSVIPHDLTLDVVILFVISFVFLIVSIFLIMLHLLTLTAHSFILYQLFVSVIILTFVMYHAQTINGGRFAEMRVNDYLLASIILFYDFSVMFLLTFYMQIHYKIATISPAGTTTKAPDDRNTTASNNSTQVRFCSISRRNNVRFWIGGPFWTRTDRFCLMALRFWDHKLRTIMSPKEPHD